MTVPWMHLNTKICDLRTSVEGWSLVKRHCWSGKKCGSSELCCFGVPPYDLTFDLKYHKAGPSMQQDL